MLRNLIRRLAATVLCLAASLSGAQAGMNRWTRGTPNWNPENVAAILLSLQNLYASNNQGLNRSTDGGSTWRLLQQPYTNYGSPLASPASSLVLYSMSSQFGVAKSRDGGETWTDVGSGLPIPDAYVSVLAISPSSPSTLYSALSVDTVTLVYRTDDGGASWLPVTSPPLDAGVGLSALAVDPLDSDTVYAGTYGQGVFRSADGGASWTSASSGLSDLHVEALYVAPSNGRTLYANTYAGIARTTDGGATWLPLAGIPSPAPNAFAIDPRDSRILYASLPGTSGYQVERSSDGGATWTVVEQDDRLSNEHAIAVGQNVVFAGGAEFLRSDDGQTGWQPVGGGSARVAGTSLWADRFAAGTLYAEGGANGLSRSDDGGETWEAASHGLPDPFISTLEQSAASGILAATVGIQVFLSGDGARTWTPYPTVGDISPLFADPDRPGNFLGEINGCGIGRCTFDSQALETTTAGASWHAIGTLSYGNFYGLARSLRTRIVFALVNSQVWWADHGSVLEPIPAVTGVARIVLDTNASVLYAFGNSVFRSDDDGATWRITAGSGLPGPYPNALGFDPTSPLRVYAAVGERVYQSADGGEHWDPLGDPLPEFDTAAIAVSSDGRTVHVGAGQAVYDYTFCDDCRRTAPPPPPPRRLPIRSTAAR